MELAKYLHYLTSQIFSARYNLYSYFFESCIPIFITCIHPLVKNNCHGGLINSYSSAITCEQYCSAEFTAVLVSSTAHAYECYMHHPMLIIVECMTSYGLSIAKFECLLKSHYLNSTLSFSILTFPLDKRVNPKKRSKQSTL